MNKSKTENAHSSNTNIYSFTNAIISAADDKDINAQIDCNANKVLANANISFERRIQNQLNQAVSDESRNRIANLLEEVGHLSDIEKLYLYVQLPTGVPVIDPLEQRNLRSPLGKKADKEILQTYSWIQTHLTEDPDVSLPKHEVYEEYRNFCEANGFDPLCTADFGKVMKHIFPSVKPRRLGTRGHSRYCYSGLRKKLLIERPSLPDLQLPGNSQNDNYHDESEEINTAACHLIFEWAEKLLTEKFCSMRELALHLVENLYIDAHSASAMKILSTSNKVKVSGFMPTKFFKECENKHNDSCITSQKKLPKLFTKEPKKKLKGLSSTSKQMNKVSKVKNKSKEPKSGLLQYTQESKGLASTTSFVTSELKANVDICQNIEAKKEQSSPLTGADNAAKTFIQSSHNEIAIDDCTNEQEYLPKICEERNNEKSRLSSSYAVMNSSLNTSSNVCCHQLNPNSVKSLTDIHQSNTVHKDANTLQSSLLPASDKHREPKHNTESNTTHISFDKNDYELGTINGHETKREDHFVSFSNDRDCGIIKKDLQLPLNEAEGINEYLMKTSFQNGNFSTKDNIANYIGKWQSAKHQFETTECNSPPKRRNTQHWLNLESRKISTDVFTASGDNLPHEENNCNEASPNRLNSRLLKCHYNSFAYPEQTVQEKEEVSGILCRSVSHDESALAKTSNDGSTNTVQLSQLRMLLERKLPQVTLSQRYSKVDTTKPNFEESPWFSHFIESTMPEEKSIPLQQELSNSNVTYLNMNPQLNCMSNSSMSRWQNEYSHLSDGNLPSYRDEYTLEGKQPLLDTLPSSEKIHQSGLFCHDSGNSHIYNSANSLNMPHFFSNGGKSCSVNPLNSSQPKSDDNLHIPHSSPTRRRPVVSPCSVHFSETNHMAHCPTSINNNRQSSLGERFVSTYSSQPGSIASSPFVSPRVTPLPFSKCMHNRDFTDQQHINQYQSYGTSNSTLISSLPNSMPGSRLRHHSWQHGEQSSLQELSSHGFNPLISRSRHFSSPVVSASKTSSDDLYNPNYLLAGSENSRFNELLLASSNNFTDESKVTSPYNNSAPIPVSECSINQVSGHYRLLAETPMYAKPPPQLNNSSEQAIETHLYDISSSVVTYSRSMKNDVLSPTHPTKSQSSHSVLINASNRCHSVPPNEMTYALVDQHSPIEPTNTFSKSYPTTPIIKHTFQFPCGTDICSNSNIYNTDGEQYNVQSVTQQVQIHSWDEVKNVDQNCMPELAVLSLDALPTSQDDCDALSRFAESMENNG